MTPDPHAKRVLRQHVQTDALLGIDVVPLGDAAPEQHAPAAASAPEPARSPVSSPPPAPAAAAPASVVVPAEQLDRDTKVRLLTEMDQNEVKPCRKCGLCQGRTQTVFGEGNPDAQLMFIGEGPGQTEDETGRPFVGRAGELLDKQIAAMGLQRSEVFIANIVKCRPPGNRAPLPPEVEACSEYLRRQIRIIAPKVIVTLGGPATKFILRTDRGITSIRGIWARYEDQGVSIPVMPTFHPAYLLRAYTVENRKKVWSDLQQVMATLKA